MDKGEGLGLTYSGTILSFCLVFEVLSCYLLFTADLCVVYTKISFMEVTFITARKLHSGSILPSVCLFLIRYRKTQIIGGVLRAIRDLFMKFTD